MQTQQARRRSGPSGCLIAVFIGVGLIVLAVVVFVIGFVRMVSDPEFKRKMAVGQSAIQVYVEAAKAPGAAELRALGCGQAMVIDANRLRQVARSLRPDAGAEVEPARLPEVISPVLVCQVVEEPRFNCEDVVRTYVTAVPDAPPQMIAMIQISRFGPVKNVCSGVYGSDGSFIKALTQDPLVGPGVSPGMGEEDANDDVPAEFDLK